MSAKKKRKRPAKDHPWRNQGLTDYQTNTQSQINQAEREHRHRDSKRERR